MKTFEIYSGKLQGFFKGKNIKDAMKRAVAKEKPEYLGVLTRFREKWVWYYQSTESLLPPNEAEASHKPR